MLHAPCYTGVFLRMFGKSGAQPRYPVRLPMKTGHPLLSCSDRVINFEFTCSYDGAETIVTVLINGVELLSCFDLEATDLVVIYCPHDEHAVPLKLVWGILQSKPFRRAVTLKRVREQKPDTSFVL